MMRPPPGGTFPHSVRCSAPQKESTSSALRGRIGGIGPSGAIVGGGAAPAAGAAGGPGGGGAAGSAVAAGGSAVAGGGGGAAAAGGGGAAAAGAGAGFAGAGAGAALSVGGGPTASSAALHDGDTLAALRLRHSSASLVPGFTPVHCAMKSERQEARIAEICSDVDCWAEAASEVPTTSPVAINRRTARQQLHASLRFCRPARCTIALMPSSMRCIAVARRLCDCGLVC
jgi:hypothetical protein